MPRWDGLTPEQRFWAKVDKGPGGKGFGKPGCWMWKAARFENGYGACKRDGKSLKAHRVAWEMKHGPVPPGKRVCHKCDVKLCVREVHFFLGTQADNVADRHAKRRDAKGDRHGKYTKPERTPRGEQHGRARLTGAAVLKARTLKARGVSYQTLVKMFGVSEGALQKAVLRETWRHL